MHAITLSDIPALSDDELQTVYEALGFEFVGDTVVLELPGRNRLSLNKATFLRPSRQDLAQLMEATKAAFGDSVELFDASDEQYERILNGQRTRRIGRILDHKEIQGLPPKVVNYFMYLEAGADGTTTDDGWVRIIQYVVCVVAAVGLVLLLAYYIPGAAKIIIANCAVIMATIAAGCVAIVESVNSSDQHHSWVRKYVAK